MAAPRLSLTKLQSRSTPSKCRNSCSNPRFKFEPTSCLLPTFKDGNQCISSSDPTICSKIDKAMTYGGILERKKNPRKNYQEHFGGNGEERQPKWSRACMCRRLGFWYIASSIRHILKRAKAFYNELCCDAYDDLTSLSAREAVAMNVDPFFSVPVVIPNESSVSI